MAEASASKVIDKKVVVSALVALLIFVALIWAYFKFMAPMAPVGGITAAAYTALSATDKAMYVLDPNGSGYYVKKAV